MTELPLSTSLTPLQQEHLQLLQQGAMFLFADMAELTAGVEMVSPDRTTFLRGLRTFFDDVHTPEQLDTRFCELIDVLGAIRPHIKDVKTDRIVRAYRNLSGIAGYETIAELVFGKLLSDRANQAIAANQQSVRSALLRDDLYV